MLKNVVLRTVQAALFIGGAVQMAQVGPAKTLKACVTCYSATSCGTYSPGARNCSISSSGCTVWNWGCS